MTTLHNVWQSHHVGVRAIDRATADLDDLRLAVSDAVRRSVPDAPVATSSPTCRGSRSTLTRLADCGWVTELGFGDDDLVVGVVANLKPHKAYEDLLPAAAACAVERG